MLYNFWKVLQDEENQAATVYVCRDPAYTISQKCYYIFTYYRVICPCKKVPIVMSLVLGENDVVFSETYDVLINTYPQGQITILNMQIHNKCFNRPLLHLTWTRRITFFKKMFGDYTTIYSVMDTLCSQCNYLG